MKKQINPSIKAHLLPTLFILLSLVAIAVIPFAQAQRHPAKQVASGSHSQVPVSAGATNVPFTPAVPNPYPSSVDGAGNTWTVRAPVPFNARGPFAVSDGTFVYVGGGYDGSTVHADLLKYDPVANTFTPLAPSADGHFLSQAVIFGTKIYNIAGFALGGQTNTTRIYDIPGNSWTTGTAIPEANGLSDAATALWNGKIYIAGGYNGSGAINTVRSYDIATDTWSTLAPLPQALYLPGFGAINGKVYVASGNNGSTQLNTLYIYDIATNTWTTGPNVPTAVTGPGSAVFNGKLYLFGGGFPTTQTITQAYDPVANTWASEANMNVNRLWFYGGAVGSSSIVAPGGDQSPGIPINDNEQYGGATPTPTPTVTPTCTPSNQYTIAQIGGSIVPGSTDIGNHGDDTVVTITLPFPYCLYDQCFTSINLSSNGNAQFTTTDATFTNVCLPWTTHNYSIFPYWDDLYLVNSGFGIFTSISGTAPNRIFNIEWRAQYFPGSGSANFELRLYEGQTRFDVIYGTVTNGNTSATAGVQKNDTSFLQYFCNGSGGAATGGQSYTLAGCATPTPTPTPTPSPTPTPCGTWTLVANMPQDFYGGAAASNGTFAYVAGGYSFSSGMTLNSLYRYDPAGNAWTTLPSYPGAGFIEALAVYYPTTNRIYVFGGEDAVSGTNYNNTRIFDIATGTWLADGATMPDVRSFMAGGYIPANGNIYVLSGYNTGQVTSAQPNTWRYNPATNVWTDLTGTNPYPHPAGGFGFGVVNNHIYTAGGRDSNNLVINLTYDFDPATLTYTLKSNEPGANNNVPGSGVAQGLLWVFGGGNPFNGAGVGPDAKAAFARQVAKMAPNAKPQVPETTNSTLTYNPSTDTWVTTALNMNSVRSFPGGTNIGNLLLAAGGYNGATTVNTAETLLTACGPTVVSAVSRVNHGACGSFDVAMPLTCPSGVEDRSTGGNYTLVVTFSGNETVTSASVTCHNPGTGTGTTGAVSGSGTPVITIPLTGVSDAQTLTVHIAGTTSVDIPMGFLIGDTNGNRVVNAADIALTKSHLGEAVTAANFREDVNANCAINAADVAIVKSKSGGAALPACCP